jgi:hypothetical protein
MAREPPETRAQEPGARYDAHRQTEPGRVEIAPRWVLGTALVHEFLEVGATSEYLWGRRGAVVSACMQGEDASTRVSTHPAKKSVAIAAAHASEMSADLMREAINGHPRASVVIRGNQWSSQAREVGGLGGSDEGWWG